MSVIVCKIPRKQDGELYCPYCSFSSYDIEDFAIAMCWDCMYKDDEKEEENLTTTTEVEENRRTAIAYLFKNPAGYRQIRLMHRNEGQGRCASGLMAEAFHIPMPVSNSGTVNMRLGELLGDNSITGTIINMNDGCNYTFRDIAEYLALRWGIDIKNFKEDK